MFKRNPNWFISSVFLYFLCRQFAKIDPSTAQLGASNVGVFNFGYGHEADPIGGRFTLWFAHFENAARILIKKTNQGKLSNWFHFVSCFVSCFVFASKSDSFRCKTITISFKFTLIPISHYKTILQIESKGPRFELGDFVIKLGNVTMSQTFKGILVEVNNS